MTIRLLLVATLLFVGIGVVSANIGASNVPARASRQLTVAARHVGAAGDTAGGYRVVPQRRTVGLPDERLADHDCCEG